MSTPIILVESRLAQAPPKTKTTKAGESQSQPTLWMAASGVMFLVLVVVVVMAKLQVGKLSKKLKFEEFKNQELQKKLKLSLDTIAKMEKNPDLIHSRDFNLDYLRMRMSEEVFHFAIVNQIKVKVKDKISVALRPKQAEEGAIGIASNSGRQVDEMFDVEYSTGDGPKGPKRVLFRIQIKLMKLPTQATSVTIKQIIDCIETYLSPSDEHDNWQPTVQGRVVHIEWDQKAKPTPLLVLEQGNEGANVTFPTKRGGTALITPSTGDLTTGMTGKTTSSRRPPSPPTAGGGKTAANGTKPKSPPGGGSRPTPPVNSQGKKSSKNK